MKRSDVGRMLDFVGLDPAEVWRVVDSALAEDLRLGPDVTSRATVPRSTSVRAEVRARERGVLAGVPVALAVLAAVDSNLEVAVTSNDGQSIEPGEVVLRIHGRAHPLLIAERTMLNLMSHLSGVATATHTWASQVAGTRAAIRDTRKTLPGLRSLQKYAVRCGGGRNHRLGLGDAVLIKDNHIAASGGIAAAVATLRAEAINVPIQVECDTVAQVEEAISAGVRCVLLDNMTLNDLTQAVRVARKHETYVELEASGGITLDHARRIAETGVDYLAIGSLTHSSPALDLGLDLTSDH